MRKKFEILVSIRSSQIALKLSGGELPEDEPVRAGGVIKQLVGFVVRILIPGLITVAGAISSPALAQAWPGKPIRIVIAQAPGSAMDFISRVVGNQLSESLGQPIVIDARPGAGGVGNNSTHGSNPAVYAKLPYDAVKYSVRLHLFALSSGPADGAPEAQVRALLAGWAVETPLRQAVGSIGHATNPRASPLYKCVARHAEELRTASTCSPCRGCCADVRAAARLAR